METLKTKTIKEMILKNGESYPAGTLATVLPKPGNDSVIQVYVPDRENPIIMGATNAHRYFDEFIPITLEVIEEASMDGACPSLLGDEVEPDGHDEYGFPSVLLAAGLI